MCEHKPIDFPDLPDEVVIAIDDLLEAFYDRFFQHYFSQMNRYCESQLRRHADELEQISLPLADPPF